MGKSFITTFTYDCEMSFVPSSGGQMDILKECVKYLVIDHDYNKRIMPVIYAKVNLTPSIYNAMVPEQGKAKVYLKLFRTRKKGSTSSSPRKVIYDQFDYYMTDDPNAYKTLDTYGEETGSSYKTCYIGLIKTDLQKKNQRSFEGVYKNTNIMSLVQEATKDMKMIIQPFVNNTAIETFTCPTVTSIGQFIAYLNSQYSFYNGSYMYYMDMDKTYLRSNDGSYIDAEDGGLKYIAIDIRDLTRYSALTSGFIEDDSQDAYIIYVSSDDAKINIDRITNELTGEVSAVSSSEQDVIDVANIDTSAITNLNNSLDAVTIINSSDPNAANNLAMRIAENTDTLIISKPDMDSRVFSPNKQYLLCNYEDNPKYTGVYYMTEKQEMYVRNGAEMTCQMNIYLKKCADYVKNGNTSDGPGAMSDDKEWSYDDFDDSEY